ncbi:MAG: dephospho-CoA kinase [Verrucomicrobiota bacterium]
MPVIGITGGVATGKSALSGMVQELFPEALFFSADSESARLISKDELVRAEVLAILGSVAFGSDGQLNRPFVRSLIFEEPDLKRKLEEILHPRIRQAWQTLAKQSKEKEQWMFAEIPLLYETSGESLCDRVVVVACSPDTQRRRMIQHRGLPETLSEQIRVAQMSLSKKCSQSDHLIWNDCSFSCLVRQARLLADWLRCRYA